MDGLPEHRPLSLAPAQLGIWTAERLAPQAGRGAGSPFVVGECVALSGALDRAALRAAVADCLAETRALSIGIDARGVPRPLSSERAHADFAELDVSGASDPAQACDLHLLGVLRAPLCLAEGPLVRVGVVRTGPRAFELYVVTHHALLDGYGLWLLLRRMAAHYAARTGVGPAPRPLPPYADVIATAVAYRGSAIEAQDRSFLLDALVDAPEPPPIGRTRALGAEGCLHAPVPVTPATWAQLSAVGRRAGGSWADAMLAAAVLFSADALDVDDVVLGLPVLARTGDALRVPAMLMNIAPLRVGLRPDDSFGTLVARVTSLRAAQAPHAQYRHEQLRRDLGRVGRGVFASVVNLMPFGGRLRFGALNGRLRNLAAGPVEDLSLTLRPGAEATGFALSLDANPLGHTQVSVNAHAEVLSACLEWATRPDRCLPRRPPEQLLHGPPLGVPVVDVLSAIEAVATRAPERPALIAGEGSVSYGELVTRCRTLASALRAAGVSHGDVVGLCLPPGVAAVIGLLGVLRAGAAYLPIDPAGPPARAATVLADARVTAVLTDVSRAAEVAPDVPRWPLDADGRPGWTFARAATLTAVDRRPPAAPAYVIYTSGSSGAEKGVLIDRAALAHFVAAAGQVYRIEASDRLLQFAPLQFDASVEEIFLTLCHGAGLVLRPSAAPMSVAGLLALVADAHVSVLDLPTALFHELCFALTHTEQRLPACVRQVIIGGEAAAAKQVRAFLAASRGQVRLLNTYGPTEATVVATCAELTPRTTLTDDVPIGTGSVDDVPIGTPLPGLTAAVRAGELYLLGPTLGRGYLGAPELTRSRFVPMAIDGGSARAYRTGDRVRLRDGQLVFVGRVDGELKLSGVRVSPAAVERVLRAAPGVRQAAVVVAGEGPARHLLAHLVPEGAWAPDEAAGVPGPLDVAALRAYCRANLLPAALPRAFKLHRQLPVNARGKLDRRALAALSSGDSDDPSRGLAVAAPRTELERLVCGLFGQVLGAPVTRVDVDFFALGGESLQVIQIANRLAAQLGREVPLSLLFEHPTAQGLARALAADEAAIAHAGLPEADIAALLRDSELPVDVQRPATDLSDASAGGGPEPAAVLLTGATGFVGAHVLAALLSDTRLVVHCLVRAPSADEARARLAAARAAHGLSWPDRAAARVQVVLGRLDAPRFGLSAREHAALSRALDGIIHCAAAVSLLRRYASLAATNVQGPLSLLRLSVADGRRAIPVHHVSTLAVGFGQTEALREDFVARPDGLPDGYARSKWAAERLLAQAHARGLPVAVYRVGRVVGARDRLFENPNDLVTHLLSGALATGLWPEPLPSEPWTPVTYLADALVQGLLRGVPAFPVLHVCPHAPVDLSHVFTAVRALRPDARAASAAELKAALSARDDADSRAILTLLQTLPTRAAPMSTARPEGPGALARHLGDQLPVCPAIEPSAVVQSLAALLPRSAAAEHPRPFDRAFVGLPSALAARYRTEGYLREESLFALLARQLSLRPDAPALSDANGRLSYAQLFERVHARALSMSTLGLSAGDAVLVQLPNRAALVEVYLAAFRLGLRPIAAQMAHRRHELVHFARTARARAFVYAGAEASSDYAALARCVAEVCPGLWQLIDADAEPAARDAASRPLSVALPAGADIGLFQLSGGSTDVPKLIARTHADYGYSVRASVAACGFGRDTVYLAALPGAHNFTLSSPGILGTLYAGGHVVFSESPAPQVALPLVARERVTVTALVPALVPAYLRRAAQGHDDLSSLKLLQVGGARLHESLARKIPEALGCRLQQVFGMAEGLVCYTDPEAPIDLVATTQGRPMSPADELRIVDDADRPVPPGAEGHLLTRGPYTLRGYYAAPEHNRSAFTGDGFYRTGDRVRQLPDGSLVVTGRSKDQINRAGDKIAAPEVEALLCAHPDVDQAALVGVPDAFLGERSVAFIVASRGVTPASVHAHLRGLGLSDFKLPDRVHLVDALPQTPIGKVDKRALRILAQRSPRP